MFTLNIHIKPERNQLTILTLISRVMIEVSMIILIYRLAHGNVMKPIFIFRPVYSRVVMLILIYRVA